MKKLFGFILVTSFLFAGTASAQVGMMYGTAQNNSAVSVSAEQDPAVSAALAVIYSSQKVADKAGLVCANVTEDQFEKLGDAVMGVGITEAQHAAMENMMGGEGSATVRQAHITMGRSYLGCWAGYSSGPVYMPMMGALSTGPSKTVGSFSGMMNRDYSRFGMMGGLFMWIIYWILFVDLVLLGVWLWKQLKK